MCIWSVSNTTYYHLHQTGFCSLNSPCLEHQWFQLLKKSNYLFHHVEKLVRENVEVDSNSEEANIEAEDQESDHAVNWYLLLFQESKQLIFPGNRCIYCNTSFKLDSKQWTGQRGVSNRTRRLLYIY